jgi:precorrin-6B C5,15-methyltransferase / cobalt-precorrin-6B C5,C15-methyltransferase
MRIDKIPVSEAEANCTHRRWLSIVGIGEDGLETLSPAAKRLIGQAELVVGGARHLALARDAIRGEVLPWPSPIHDVWPRLEAMRGRPVAVLASGDPFFYGVGTQIAARFSEDETLCLPQPSAFSLAAARLKWSLQDTALATLHGRRLEGIVRYLQPGARILALSWDGETPGKLAALLTERGMGESDLTALEALGGPHERVRETTASAFALGDVSPLNVIAVEVRAEADARIVSLAPGLDDSLFEHDGQLTKREIRAVTLASLAPRQGELLWDVGLGAGSVAIEWLLCHPAMRAVGFEERPDRAERAARNAIALGTPDLQIVVALAPVSFAGAPPPDAVFIGGGLGDPGLFEAAWSALKAGGRLVANAVSLESEARLVELSQRLGGDLTRLNVARAERLGGMTTWQPAKPITQWRVQKP